MMEVSHNVGVKNRYSCFLLLDEGEVPDVSVVENDVAVKKKKNLVATTPVLAKAKASGQPGPQVGKAAANEKEKGPVQAQAPKKSGTPVPPKTVVFVSKAPMNGKNESGDAKANKSYAEKLVKGKGDYNEPPRSRFPRSARYDNSKTDEVVENKEVFSNTSADEIEKSNNDTEGEIVNENEMEEMVEEAKLMTLAEWKALQQPREKPVYNLRQPGEGEDLSQWTKMILKKDKLENEDDHPSEELEYSEGEYPQRAGRRKKLQIDCLFVGLPREKERGDGGRDIRNKDKVRKNRYNWGENKTMYQSAPKVDDINDFPSLG